MAVATWLAVVGGAVLLALLRRAYVQPPEVIGTELSDGWLRHTKYQLTKPGGAMERYGADRPEWADECEGY